jgi:hypothetical protein
MHISDDADEYKYVLDDPADIRVGDEVTFVITNSGHLPHDVQITDASGRQLAVPDPVPLRRRPRQRVGGSSPLSPTKRKTW